MSRLYITIILSMLCLIGIRAAKPSIKHVHPTNWWCGMEEPELQILLYGTNIGIYDVELKNTKGITLKSINKFDNKNYIIIYVDTKNAPAQTFNINLLKGR